MDSLSKAQDAYDHLEPAQDCGSSNQLHELIYEQEKALLTQALAEGRMLRDFRKDGSQFEYDPVDEVNSEVSPDAMRALFQAIALDSSAQEVGQIAKEMFAQAMHAYCINAADREVA